MMRPAAIHLHLVTGDSPSSATPPYLVMIPPNVNVDSALRANAALLPTPRRAIRPASERRRRPGRRLISVTQIAGVGSFQRIGLRRPDETEGVTAHLHVAKRLRDLRHVAGDALAAGAARGVMG